MLQDDLRLAFYSISLKQELTALPIGYFTDELQHHITDITVD